MIVEDGTGVTDANSYVDAESAETVAYFAGHVGAAAWTAATLAQKEAALIMATRHIDVGFIFAGVTVSPTQSLEWPRYGVEFRGAVLPGSEIPRRLRDATREAALAFLRDGDRSSPATAAPAPLASLNLGKGALQLGFAVKPSTESQPLAILPDIVSRMLEGLAISGGQGRALK